MNEKWRDFIDIKASFCQILRKKIGKVLYSYTLLSLCLFLLEYHLNGSSGEKVALFCGPVAQIGSQDNTARCEGSGTGECINI